MIDWILCLKNYLFLETEIKLVYSTLLKQNVVADKNLSKQGLL